VAELTFRVTGARAEPYAASPLLVVGLEVTDPDGDDVRVVGLRCQVRIEPRQRPYTDLEAERLSDLFGERARWADTMQPLLWTHASVVVPGFRGSTQVDLPIPCSYDFEVASAKFFHALDGGTVPLRLLFSGTVFTQRAQGVTAEPVPWHAEVAYRLPVEVYREVIDRHFPDSAWLRLRRETFDALHRFRSRRALPSWELAIEALLRETGESGSA
jgi:uncharacterized protein DUF6084